MAMKGAITLGNKLTKGTVTTPRARSLLLFFRRMDRKGCTEKILVGTLLHQQDNSMYISKTENGKGLRREKENYLFNVTENIALILITLGAHMSLQVAL